MKTPNYNYTSVDPIIVERIRRRCEELNYELAFTSLLSCHPDDDYLYVVLARNLSNFPNIKPYNNYTVWEYNSESDSLFWGKYEQNFSEALKFFTNKINFYND